MATAGVWQCGWLFHWVKRNDEERPRLVAACMEDDPTQAATVEWAQHVVSAVREQLIPVDLDEVPCPCPAHEILRAAAPT